jgi:hypothetical protein
MRYGFDAEGAPVGQQRFERAHGARGNQDRHVATASSEAVLGELAAAGVPAVRCAMFTDIFESRALRARD